MSHLAGPTQGQRQRLQELCAQTGQRYQNPRTRKQASAQIRDLEIRAKNNRRAARAQPAPQPRYYDAERVRRLMTELSAVYHRSAYRNGRAFDALIAQAHDLTLRIDREMSLPD